MQAAGGKRRGVMSEDSGLGDLVRFGAVWPHFCELLSAMEDVPLLRCCSRSLSTTSYVVTCVRLRNSYGVVAEPTQRARRSRLPRVCALLPRMFEGDRKRVVWGKCVSVRVDQGGRR